MGRWAPRVHAEFAAGLCVADRCVSACSIRRWPHFRRLVGVAKSLVKGGHTDRTQEILTFCVMAVLCHTLRMPARASRGGKRADVAQNALRVVEEVIGEVLKPAEHKNPHAQALSALGASKGGKARAEKLSEKKRKEIARKAAKARWSSKTP
jgi:hypothetical protein